MSNSGTYKFDKDERRWVLVSDRTHGFPDVYFAGEGIEPNLATESAPLGVFVHSKRHKAEIMRRQGISECGDRVHGAR